MRPAVDLQQESPDEPGMRVLIATVTAGAGHLQAALAVEEAWRAFRPSDQIERVDLLDYVPRLQRKITTEGYIGLVEHAPELWGMVFRKTDNPLLVRKLSRFHRAFAKYSNAAFFKFVKRFQPRVVICTHYFPLRIVGQLEAENAGWRPHTVSVITDFEAHSLWMEEAVDLYCVAAEETKASLAARGARPESVAVTGIPIASKFSGPVDASAFRRSIGLRDELPVLLILGGGFGLGPVAEMLRAIDRVESSFQVIVVTGKNAELRRELACEDYRHPTRVVGFVNNMHEFMAVSSVIITKPGGLTCSEALAVGRPLLIFNPIPGQEAANSDFLLQKRAAAKVNRIEDLPFRLDQLLASNELNDMAEAARRLGRPEAARTICQAVLERYGC